MEDKKNDFQLADLGERLIASIIDSLLIGVIVTVIDLIFGFILIMITVSVTYDVQNVSYSTMGGLFALLLGGFFIINILNLAFSTCYYFFMTAYKGATVGKLVVKIKVVDENYQKITYSTAFTREVIGKFASSIIFGLGFIWILFDENKQGWHDKIAHTYVVKIIEKKQ